MQQKDVFCFHIHSVSLCHFIGELNPLILRDINDQWLLIPVIFLFLLLLVIVCLCFSSLGFASVGISIAYCCFLWVWLTSLGWKFPSSILCRAGFMDNLNQVLP